MTICACGCGAQLTRGKRGPARVYASPACRKRAERRRRAEVEYLPADVRIEPVTLSAVATDVQIERALIEARAVGFALLRLGAEARPELGWRCTRLGTAILDGMTASFPEVNR